MPRSLTRSAGLPALALLVAAAASPAWAWVPSRTCVEREKDTETCLSPGVPVRWMETNCVRIQINSLGSADVTDGSDVAAARRALDNWNKAVGQCSYIQLVELPPAPDARPSVDDEGNNTADHRNVIYFVEQGWSHDRSAAAITTVFYIERADSPNNGRILDADVELNGQFFRFTTDGKKLHTDIENTVTHELGHLLGLDHPCHDGAHAYRPTDSEGTPIPDCNDVIGSSTPEYAAMREVTMFNFAEPGETRKRSLAQDDIDGVCSTYPLSADPGVCQDPRGDRDGGCRIAGARGRSPGAALALPALLVLGLLLAARRPLRRR